MKLRLTSGRDRRRIAVTVLGTVLVVSACSNELLDPGDDSGNAQLVVPEDWQGFPLMMVNVTAADVPDVAHLVDVVSYSSTFAPYDTPLGSQFDNDLLSFRIHLHAGPLVDAATAAGIHVAVTAPLLAHPNAISNPGDPQLVGNGVVADDRLWVNPAVVPGCNQPGIGPGSDPECIQVPTRFDEVTPEYVDYWGAKLANFFTGIEKLDQGSGTVWGVHGADEIRPWGAEYAAQRRLRVEMDNHPAMAGLPLVAYSPHNRLPEHLASTLLVSPPGVTDGSLNVSYTPAVPYTLRPTWDVCIPEPPAVSCTCQAIRTGCTVLGFEDYYPHQQEFATGPGGELMPIQTHVMRGSYLGLLLGASGHTNRVASFHRMNAQREALEIVEAAYLQNGQPAPQHLAVHMPGMNLCSLSEAQTTAAEARHDFWSGVHRGQGILIYNYQSVVQANNPPIPDICGPSADPATPEQVLTVWNEYEIGLQLIKSTLREFLLHGERTEPAVITDVIASETAVIPGTDYLIDHPIFGADATFAMPDYPALQGSAYRICSTVYLIVTGSYDQTVDFIVQVGDSMEEVEVVHGDGGTVSFSGDELIDSLSGIDGRVYRLEMDSGEDCP